MQNKYLDSFTVENLDSNPALDVKTMTVAELAIHHNVTLDVILSQVTKGVKVELEHTTDPEVAMEIACDHLKEFVDYYDRLKEMESK